MAERVFQVAAGALNLRVGPEADRAPVAVLTQGQLVARLDEEDRNGWWWVFADVPGDGAFLGYVAARHLSPITAVPGGPTQDPGEDAPSDLAGLGPGAPSAFVDRLVRIAQEQNARFDAGKIKETSEAGAAMVAAYWQAVGQPQWDGRTDQPWSAAFISWCLREAGAGPPAFLPSTMHAAYINDAIRRRDDPAAAFSAFDLDAAPPRLGDLIAGWRNTPSTRQPITLANALARGAYSSHTDIVVAVRSDAIDVVGGNVSNSVTRRTLNLRPDGLIDPSYRTHGAFRLFAVLRNNL